MAGADGLPRFVTAVGDHRLIWALDVDAWSDIACQAAGRNLSFEEWEQFVGDRADYRPTCDQWPSAEASDPSQVRPEVSTPRSPDRTPLEVLADDAAIEIKELLEAGDEDAAEARCEAYRLELAAEATPEAMEAAQIIGNRFHRYWTIEQAIGLCAGRSFPIALNNLTVALDDPSAVCGGYPSPCPEARS